MTAIGIESSISPSKEQTVGDELEDLIVEAQTARTETHQSDTSGPTNTT